MEYVFLALVAICMGLAHLYQRYDGNGLQKQLSDQKKIIDDLIIKNQKLSKDIKKLEKEVAETIIELSDLVKDVIEKTNPSKK